VENKHSKFNEDLEEYPYQVGLSGVAHFRYGALVTIWRIKIIFWHLVQKWRFGKKL